MVKMSLCIILFLCLMFNLSTINFSTHICIYWYSWFRRYTFNIAANVSRYLCLSLDCGAIVLMYSILAMNPSTVSVEASDHPYIHFNGCT